MIKTHRQKNNISRIFMKQNKIMMLAFWAIKYWTTWVVVQNEPTLDIFHRILTIFQHYGCRTCGLLFLTRNLSSCTRRMSSSPSTRGRSSSWLRRRSPFIDKKNMFFFKKNQIFFASGQCIIMLAPPISCHVEVL